MDYTAAVEVGCLALTGVGAVFAYLWRRSESSRDDAIKEHTKQIEALATALANHKLYVAEHYVTQSELTKAVENLDKTMQRLFDAVTQNTKETRDGFSELHRRIDMKADK